MVLNIFKKEDKALSFENLFIILSLAIILISWLALLLTIGQIFYTPLLVTGIIFILFAIFLFLRKFQRIQKPNKIEIVILIFIVLFAIFNAYFAHETFEGGQDQGMYSNWAVYLSRHSTYYSEEPVMRPAEVRWRPGGHQPGFHFAYISWLALHHKFLGIGGIKIANFLPLIIALLSLYFVGRKIKGRKTGLFTLLMLVTSFPLIWFCRRTMTEVYAMALFWFGLLCFIKAYKKDRASYFTLSLVSIGLLLFTRGEAIWIFGATIALIFFFFIFTKRRGIARETINKGNTVALSVILILFFYYSKWVNPNFFQNIYPLMTEQIKTFLSHKNAITDIVQGELNYIQAHPTKYIANVLLSYNLLIPTLILFFTLLMAIVYFKKNKANKYILIAGFMLLPSLISLFTLTTYYTQPWMLRRFLPYIIPFTYLCTALFLVRYTKKFKYFILLFIIGANLVISVPILTYAEYKSITPQVKEIADIIPSDGVIFYEAGSSGPFQLGTPLYFIFDKNITYTYSGEIIGFINWTKGKSSYILCRSDLTLESYLPQGSVELLKERRFRYKSMEKIGLSMKITEFLVRNKIYYKTPQWIKENVYNLRLYKVKEPFKGFLQDDTIFLRKNWTFHNRSLIGPKGKSNYIYHRIDNLWGKDSKPEFHKEVKILFEGPIPKIFIVIPGVRIEEITNVKQEGQWLIADLKKYRDNVEKNHMYNLYLRSDEGDIKIKKILFD